MQPKQLKELREKSKRLSVRLIWPARRGDPYTAIVGSRSNSVFNHFVTVRFLSDGTVRARCTCPWAEHGGIGCTHVIAALSRLAAEKHRVLSFWPTFEEASRQKRSVFKLDGAMPQDKIWITSRRAS